MKIEESKTKNEIVIYQPDDITRLEVRLSEETVLIMMDKRADFRQSARPFLGH